MTIKNVGKTNENLLYNILNYVFASFVCYVDTLKGKIVEYINDNTRFFTLLSSVNWSKQSDKLELLNTTLTSVDDLWGVMQGLLIIGLNVQRFF